MFGDKDSRSGEFNSIGWTNLETILEDDVEETDDLEAPINEYLSQCQINHFDPDDDLDNDDDDKIDNLLTNTQKIFSKWVERTVKNPDPSM